MEMVTPMRGMRWRSDQSLTHVLAHVGEEDFARGWRYRITKLRPQVNTKYKACGSDLRHREELGWVRMGAALSVGIDIDPQAVTSARQNIALNKIDSSRMLVYLVPSKVGPQTVVGRTSNNPEDKTPYDLELNAEREKFDIVIANILLNPLLELAEDIVAYGKPGAIIGVSGILSEQLHEIQELYSRFLDSVSISELDGWACLSGTKRCDVRTSRKLD